MTQRNRFFTVLSAAALIALIVAPLQAQTGANAIYWQGGDGTLTDANYTDLTLTGLTPASNNTVFFGGSDATGVTGSYSSVVPLDLGRLFIGYGDTNDAPDVTAYDGEGTLNVSGGAQINLVAGASGTDNAGLTIGSVRDGVLNIDGAGTKVTSNRLVIIGVATSQVNRSGTVNVTNGGSLIATLGNIDLGTGGVATNNGTQGHLFVSGENSLVQALDTGAANPSADLNIGIRKASSSVTQSGGLIDIADVIEVGFGGNGTIANPNSSYNISGGLTRNGGNFFVGRGASTGATVNITGGEIAVGTAATETDPARGRFLMGANTATGMVVNHSAGTLGTALDVRVGDASTGTATYNLSGTGVINASTGGHVGRSGTGIFLQTGGTANFNGATGLQIGDREVATNPNSGLYEISGGDLNIAGALNIATSGVGQFRVVGDDATIDVGGNFTLNTGANGNGTLAFELESGDLLSRINVVGSATLAAGTSLILDDSNFSPSQTSYELLSAASITDSGLVFTGPAGWTHSIVSGGLGQILKVSAPGAVEDADFDQDGDIDGADFLTWQRNVATPSPTLAQGNANGDTVVDGADLAIWESQFGTSVAAAAAVPEPGAAVLLLSSLVTVAAWRRRLRG